MKQNTNTCVATNLAHHTPHPPTHSYTHAQPHTHNHTTPRSRHPSRRLLLRCELQGFVYQPLTEYTGITACIPYRNASAPSAYLPATVPLAPPHEQHGPYQHGAGFPAVNGGDMNEAFDTMLPPALKPLAPYGPAAPGTFVSEFGASSMSRCAARSTWTASIVCVCAVWGFCVCLCVSLCVVCVLCSVNLRSIKL